MAEQFEDVPLLTKATIKDNLERLQSDDLDSRNWRWNHTGGSTGQPLTVAQDRVYDYWRVASERFFYEQMLGVNEPAHQLIVLRKIESKNLIIVVSMW